MFTRFVNQLRHAASAVTRGTAALGLAGLLALGAVASNDVEIDVERLNSSFIKTISENPSIYLSEYAEKIKVKIQFWEPDLGKKKFT